MEYPVTRTQSLSARALGGILSIALAMTGFSVLAAAPAAAATAVVYDSIPSNQPASYPSLGFQAQATWEFGDYVLLGGKNRVVTNVTISLTSWACETGGWSTGDCVTAPGSTFDHPVTMNLYEADNSGSLPVAGPLIASVTQIVAAPYRPSPSPAQCGVNATTWWDAVGEVCRNGFAFDVPFDFSSANAFVGNDVIVTVAYDTQSYGANPTGFDGPYNALNVSLNNLAVPAVGTDENAGEMMRDTTYLGETRGLKTSTLISTFKGLVMEISAAAVPAIDPLTDVTVFDRDVKPNETPATYTSWHEGKASATPSQASVKSDGLHLADTAPIRVIKGTDIAANPADQLVTRNELRSLIERASVVVGSGSVTYQISLFFGPNPNAPLFTTLRSTSLMTGSHAFSQADTWATTRAFPGYTPQQEAPLGELIDAVFAQGGSVALAAYGVQADSPAVVSKIVWDDTRYTFFQPVIEPCVPAIGPEVTNLAPGSWDFSQTRTQGTNVFTEGGLQVTTFDDGDGPGSPDQRKAAGYAPIDIALSDVGSVGFDIAPGFTGVRPGLQLGFDADADGDRDAYLVGEPWAYGGGVWSPNLNGDWADANFWVTGNVGFGVPPGSGYPSLGTLNAYLLANPEARITEYGYSLGSGVVGSALIRSITVGCTTTPFGLQIAPPPPPPLPPLSERLFGVDRYATAVEVSKSAFAGGADTVFIATGTGFADALSAAPAAAVEGGPLLLTAPTQLPQVVIDELVRLDPDLVFVVGGAGAVSTAVENAIRNLTIAPTVERIDGVDRYATSRGIADRFFTTALNAFMATGSDFPDALAAGPAAAEEDAPVILVPGAQASVDNETMLLLASLNTVKVYLAGGTSVLSEGIETQLEESPGITVDRLAGADRYATAVDINDTIFGSTTRVYKATGLNFADALAGGAAAANRGTPLYITPSECVPSTVLNSITLRGPLKIYILGGTSVLTTNIENLVVC